MNPLDARCNISRNDAICVSQLKNAKHIDPAILQERPDVKIFLPFRFFVYRPEMLFQPNTYNRYLGEISHPIHFMHFVVSQVVVGIKIIFLIYSGSWR